MMMMNINFVIFNNQSREEHRRSTVLRFVFLVPYGVQLKAEHIRTAILTVLYFLML